MSDPQYAVITPVRNEAGFVSATIASMARQTILPRRWVMVDDGSTDSTGAILQAAALEHSWITVVRRPDRGFRRTGGGVVEAFNDGYNALGMTKWDFLVKLDGDLSFDPEYFETCFSHFFADDRLGIGGGTIYVMRDSGPEVDSPGDPPFHVRGATKIYRRTCWEQIQPLVPAPGWDTIDEVRANMLAWRTRTFADATLVQHRATGAVAGSWPNWYKNGIANYITGYHPLFMLAKCLRRLWRQPRFTAAAALWLGFCSGYLKRPRCVAEPAAVRYLRHQQILCLLRRPNLYDLP